MVVLAVVSPIAVVFFASPVAACDETLPCADPTTGPGEQFPDSALDDHFPDSPFDGTENLPDSAFDGEGPSLDPIFDDGDEDGSDPVISG